MRERREPERASEQLLASLARAFAASGFAVDDLSLYGERVTVVFADPASLTHLRALLDSRSGKFARRARGEERARAWRYQHLPGSPPQLMLPIEDIAPLTQVLEETAASDGAVPTGDS